MRDLGESWQGLVQVCDELSAFRRRIESVIT